MLVWPRGIARSVFFPSKFQTEKIFQVKNRRFGIYNPLIIENKIHLFIHQFILGMLIYNKISSVDLPISKSFLKTFQLYFSICELKGNIQILKHRVWYLDKRKQYQ